MRSVSSIFHRPTKATEVLYMSIYDRELIDRHGRDELCPFLVKRWREAHNGLDPIKIARQNESEDNKEATLCLYVLWWWMMVGLTLCRMTFNIHGLSLQSIEMMVGWVSIVSVPYIIHIDYLKRRRRHRFKVDVWCLVSAHKDVEKLLGINPDELERLDETFLRRKARDHLKKLTSKFSELNGRDDSMHPERASEETIEATTGFLDTFRVFVERGWVEKGTENQFITVSFR